jgi:hypothetical protein
MTQRTAFVNIDETLWRPFLRVGQSATVAYRPVLIKLFARQSSQQNLQAIHIGLTIPTVN